MLASETLGTNVSEMFAVSIQLWLQLFQLR